MIRMSVLAVLVAGSAVGMPGACAQNGQVENEDARFTFHRADEGYLRLDGHSGEVSSCTRRPAGWLCQPVPDERAALEAEIARLQSDNGALKKELLTHKLPLPAGIKPDQQPTTAEKQPQTLPHDVEIKEVVGFIGKVWRRLVEMVANVQRDILKKT